MKRYNSTGVERETYLWRAQTSRPPEAQVGTNTAGTVYQRTGIHKCAAAESEYAILAEGFAKGDWGNLQEKRFIPPTYGGAHAGRAGRGPFISRVLS